MKNLFKHIILFVAVSIFGLNAVYAQVYPVQLTPVFNTPYNVKLSDYATSMDTKMRLMINPVDITISNRQVRLKLSIKGNGLNIQNSDYIQGQQPIFINGGEFQTLTNTDLAALFRLENLQGITALQYANGLPEGMYDFCFEMYDFVTNQRISQKSCAMMYLILNDPPLLNTPQKNEQIAATDFPNILFTWTPRNRNATNVSYKFELKQLMDPTMDPQFVFQMSPILYEETLFGTALLYNLNMPILTPGMRYAWRIRAISTTGLSENSIFKNDGYSEIYSFKYTASCAAPTFLLSEAQGPTSVKVSWQGIPDHTRYQIQYKKQDVRNAQWFSTNSLNTQSLITNLEPGVTYQFRVGSSCDPATDGIQSFTYSGISTFTTSTQANGVPAYNCGIIPKINIQNQKPLTNLIQSETFTAGDFPVTVLELKGENSPYSGRGYIIVPYLADTKIAVEFNSIVINTDYQLISGVVETSYNPDWKNVVDIDKLVDDVKEIISDFPEINIFSPNETIAQKDTSNKPDDTNSIVVNDSNPSSTIPTENNSQGNISSNASNNNCSSTSSSNNSTASNTNASNNTAGNKTPILEKVKFESATLTACDTKTKKRIAKEGETLYYVNTSSSKIDKTDIALTINQKLTKEKIKDNVHWFSNNTVIDNSDGMLKFTTKDLDKDATIKSVAGFPTESTKIVDVKLVDENRQKIDIVKKMSPLLSVFNEINYWTKEFKTFGVPCSVSILDDVKKAINKNQLSVSYHKYNEEIETNRLYNKVQEFEFGATGMEIFKLSCGKEIKVKIPFTSYELELASANIEVAAGLKGAINIKREETVETNKISYGNSKASGGGYISPNVNTSLLGVKGIAELEAGLKFEYPYKGSKTTVGFILYSDDFVGKVLVSKDTSIFVSKDFIYEIFRLPTTCRIPVFEIEINGLLK